MAEDSLEAIRHDFDELAAFLGVNARFDGLESELRHRFKQIDCLEERSDETLCSSRPHRNPARAHREDAGQGPERWGAALNANGSPGLRGAIGGTATMTEYVQRYAI